jgi:hypothetical protein
MKPPKFILLAAMVLAGAGWLWHGETERQNLKTRISRLRAQLDRPAPDHDPRPRQAWRSALERKPVDWQAVAKELRGGKPIGGLLVMNARLLELIDAMSVAELVAALDEVAAADLEKGDREALEQRLAAVLITKDPEQGFTRFTVRERSDWSFFLGYHFDQWVTRDKEASLAWLQKHAAGGGHIFDRMISDPFFGHLDTQPETSAALLTTLPPEKRLESLRSLAVASLKEGGQQEWAKLLRVNLPPEDRLDAITWPLMNWSDGDGAPMRLDEVDAYLGRINASEEERNACIMTVAADPHSWKSERRDPVEGRDALEQMRSWVEGHAPEMLEAATIRAVGSLAHNSSFDEASALALEFHEKSRNDAYLTGVLDQVDDLSDGEAVREMVQRLADPDLQAKYREELQNKLK